MAKLTLSVDDRVVVRAKRYAKLRGVSISQMVETYLAAVAEPSSPNSKATPVLQAVRGILKRVDLDDHQKHLAAKYR